MFIFATSASHAGPLLPDQSTPKYPHVCFFDLLNGHWQARNCLHHLCTQAVFVTHQSRGCAADTSTMTYEGSCHNSMLPHLNPQSTFNRQEGQLLAQQLRNDHGQPRESHTAGPSGDIHVRQEPKMSRPTCCDPNRPGLKACHLPASSPLLVCRFTRRAAVKGLCCQISTYEKTLPCDCRLEHLPFDTLRTPIEGSLRQQFDDIYLQKWLIEKRKHVISCNAAGSG